MTLPNANLYFNPTLCWAYDTLLILEIRGDRRLLDGQHRGIGACRWRSRRSYHPILNGELSLPPTAYVPRIASALEVDIAPPEAVVAIAIVVGAPKDLRAAHSPIHTTFRIQG